MRLLVSLILAVGLATTAIPQQRAEAGLRSIVRKCGRKIKQASKTLHKCTTKPTYKHVLRPVGKGVAKAAKFTHKYTTKPTFNHVLKPTGKFVAKHPFKIAGGVVVLIVGGEAVVDRQHNPRHPPIICYPLGCDF